METKKLILAIALSIIVITLYQYLFMPKPAEKKVVPLSEKSVQQQGTIPESTNDAAADSKSLTDIFSKTEKKEIKKETVLVPASENLKGSEIKDITIETSLYKAVFTNSGAGLKSFILKNYEDDKKNHLDLISEKVNDALGRESLPFYFSIFDQEKFVTDINKEKFFYNGPAEIKLTGSANREIVFKYSDVEKDIQVEKRFVFQNNSYVIGTKVNVIKAGKKIDIPVIFGPDLENNIASMRAPATSLILKGYDGNEILDVKFSGVKVEKVGDSLISKGSGSFRGFFYWIAYERPYFAAMIRTEKRDAAIKYYTVKVKGDKNQVKNYSFITFTNPVSFYFGPKDEEELEKIEGIFPDANKIIDYGWAIFGAIAKVMLKGLNLIQQYIPNYGWALVFFTIIIKILLFPLTYSSSVSMAKMQTLQPKIKAIKKKYKNLKDPEQRKKMNVETMALYKSEKVNPAGGCLPLLLQMPVFFGLFRLLQTSINIRHEPWILWIQDLSLKDSFYVLPILMGVTQLIVSKMSPTSADSSQKKITYIMPVVMVFLFMNFSSGLNLYWFISNLLQIGQQHIINKKIFHDKKEEEKLQKVLKKKKRGK
ncbi:MAG: membrane protein insertase YidC [Acidobacteriota bacterium]